MHWQDDYLDYSYSPPGAARLRLQAYVDGRLVDSWTEPLPGSRWERLADQFDEARRPQPVRSPESPRHQQVLRWLDGVVGGRAALLALSDEQHGPEPQPELPDAESQAAYDGVREALSRVGREFLEEEARQVLDRSLVMLWRAAPHVVTGARSPSTVAGGLLWVVGKANGLFEGGFTQQLVRRELWLKQGLNVPGQAVAGQLRGIDFDSQRRPHGCPDLASFARPELLTSRTRRTLVRWRDLALALEGADVLPSKVES